MYKNIYEKYHAAYNELKKNFSDHNKYQFDKNPTGFYMTFITWCEKYQAAKNFDFDNFDHERAYEFKQLLKDPIKNFNYVFGNEVFTFFKKETLEKIIKILNEPEETKYISNLTYLRKE